MITLPQKCRERAYRNILRTIISTLWRMELLQGGRRSKVFRGLQQQKKKTREKKRERGRQIGMIASQDARWYGLRLSRKKGSGPWLRVVGAGGDDTSIAGATCWIANNNTSRDDNEIGNLGNSYLDFPNTTQLVHYTVYWKCRLGDNLGTGTLYINRVHNQNDAFRAKPISTIEATEIWNEGVPYVPIPSTPITILNNLIGIGKANPSYNLDVLGNFNYTGDLYKNSILFTGGGGSSDWIKTGFNISYNAGNVGIGNTAPSYPLTVGTNLIAGSNGKISKK